MIKDMSIQETLKHLDELEAKVGGKIFSSEECQIYACALTVYYPSLRAEIERLQGEVEKLKQTSVEVERPDGSKAYVQVHCTYPHDHIVHLGSGIKML